MVKKEHSLIEGLLIMGEVAAMILLLLALRPGRRNGGKENLGIFSFKVHSSDASESGKK